MISADRILAALRRVRGRTPVALLLLLGAAPATSALAQQAADSAAAASGEGGGLVLWNVISKAGGFQYPIFGILVIGLFLIAAKVYELARDRRASRDLEAASIEEMDPDDLAEFVAGQPQSMVAELHATLLNVYQTTRDPGTLHEEIANFIQFQRERFDTFKRRVDFLADTAGAVGLLGTVWGMFTLFYGGNVSDKQAILSGMGVALVSTLLGLVVSITLNLISTEVYSFFDNRIDQIEEASDKLRFRLMELGPGSNGAAAARDGRAASESTASRPAASRSASADRPAGSAAANGGAARAGAGSAAEQAATAAAPAGTATADEDPDPERLEVEGLPKEKRVDATIEDVRLRASAGDGTPVAGVPVRVRVGDDSGTLNGGQAEVSMRTDEDGQVAFDWALPEAPGSCRAKAAVGTGGADAARTLSVAATPGPPRHYRQDGDNQGAEAGDEVPNPLAVTLLDRWRNPVPDRPVQFRVTGGGATFADGSQTTTVRTDDEGVAAVALTVGTEPGLNTVEASVGNETIEFQAMTLTQ
jgi:biopolymer transport protein ExbB/TolQ